MTTQNIVVESGEPTARWGTTLLVIFGPTLVMLLIAGFLTEILHYASTGLAFANAYVFATIGMQLLFLALVAWLLQKEGSGLLRLINIVPSQLPKQLGIGLIVLLICLVISLLSTSFGAQPGSAVVLSGFPYFFALVIGSAVAGLSVEIIWRGYGLTRLKVLTKSTVWAVVIQHDWLGALAPQPGVDRRQCDRRAAL